MTTYQISRATPSETHGPQEVAVVVNRSGSEFTGTAGVGTDGTVYNSHFPDGMVHPAHASEQKLAVHEAIRATAADGEPRSLSYGVPRTSEHQI